MAEPAPLLKDGFSATTVGGIAERLLAAAPGFDSRAFIHRCLAGFDELSLIERVRRVAEVMVVSLPQDYPEALAIVERALGEPPLALLSGEGIAAFCWAPFLEFVALAGIADPARSLPALSRLTRHFTAEFAIRPFLDQHPELSRQHIASWVACVDRSSLRPSIFLPRPFDAVLRSGAQHFAGAFVPRPQDLKIAGSINMTSRRRLQRSE